MYGLNSLMMKLAELDVQVRANGDRLRYRPRLTGDVLFSLQAFKGELLAMVAPVDGQWRDVSRLLADKLMRPVDGRPASPDDLGDDWRDWYEERAAIKEYDGNLPRYLAEAMAWQETMQAMKVRADLLLRDMGISA